MGLLKRKSSNRTILVALSDTHGGNKLGLMSPDVVLYDESPDGEKVPYTPAMSVTQKYLWDLYISHVQEVKQIAGKDRVCVLHVGDLTQGTKYMQSLVSTRIADQIVIAAENLRPWCEMENVTHIRLAAGTQSHEFMESTSPIILSNELAKEFPDKDIKMCQHGLLDVDGVTIDYAHHGPYPGSRVWLKGNVARYYLRDLMMRDIMNGNVPPTLVLRAHYHTPVEEYLKIMGHASWLYVLPSYCALGIYDRQATRSVNSFTNGMNVYEIMDGEIKQTYELHNKVDVRTKEAI